MGFSFRCVSSASEFFVFDPWLSCVWWVDCGGLPSLVVDCLISVPANWNVPNHVVLASRWTPRSLLNHTLIFWC